MYDKGLFKQKQLYIYIYIVFFTNRSVAPNRRCPGPKSEMMGPLIPRWGRKLIGVCRK